MKNKTLLLLSLTVLTLTSSILFSLSNVPGKSLLSAFSSGLGLLFFLTLTGTWLLYVANLVSITTSALGKQNAKNNLTLKNLDVLVENNTLIQKKFQLSANFISKLTEPESKIDIDEFFHNDPIGQSLLRIKAELKKWKEVEVKRNWIAQGLAKFSEILRDKKSNITEYSQHILGNLVKYLNASQGILLLETTDEKGDSCMEAAARFGMAHSNVNVRIYEGQGMLGQCMTEKRILLINEIPKNYIKINSGLGQAIPKNIIIVPLLTNEKFYGAIEVASFQEIGTYEVEFLKEVSKNIASEIASIKNYQQTQKLLNESNSLARELKQQEFELRNNLEVLSRTQQEMVYKQRELAEIHKAINGTLATAEFDLSGRMVRTNEIFLTVLGYKPEELKSIYCQQLMGDASSSALMWDNLRLGRNFSGEFRMKNKAGKDIWLSGTFNAISISDNGPEKVMMFAQFISQEKDKINELSFVVSALKSTLPVAELDANFFCRSANEKFMKMFGLSRTALRNKSIADFIEPSYMPSFTNIVSEIKNKDFVTLLLPLLVQEKVVTAEVTLTIAKDQEKNIVRVIFLVAKEIESEVPVVKIVQ